MDEKGFILGFIRKMLRIIIRESREQGKLQSSSQDGSREWITIIACICVDMSYLPPAIIYKGKGNLQNTWLDDYTPEEEPAYFASSPNGWTSDSLGVDWLEHVFDRHIKQKARHGRDPRLLILDGHGSHITMRFLDYCEKHNIHIVLFPPHTPHRLQPLDVSLFRPLSDYYSTNLDNWHVATEGLNRLGKRDFWQLFYPAFTRAFGKEKNIENSWRDTGLLPWDLERVPQRIKRPKNWTNKDAGSIRVEDFPLIRRIFRRNANAPECLAELVPRLLHTCEIQQIEIFSLQRQLRIISAAIQQEKKHHKRGRPLFDELLKIPQGQAAYFSPNKIREARTKLQAKEDEEEAQRARKLALKEKKCLAKEACEAQQAHKRAMHEELQARAREDARLQEEATQQLAQQLRSVPRVRRRHILLTSLSERSSEEASTIPSSKSIWETNSSNDEVDSTSLRPQRQRRLPLCLRDS